MQQESAQVAFIIIPVHKFDGRNAFVRKLTPFSLEKKRSMPSWSQSEKKSWSLPLQVEGCCAMFFSTLAEEMVTITPSHTVLSFLMKPRFHPHYSN